MGSYREMLFDETLATGVDEIDSQHRNLINLANEAAAALRQGVTPTQLRHLVRELLAYAIYHFRTEEALMKEYAYDVEAAADATTHIARHRAFADKIATMQQALQNREHIDFDQLINFLYDWIAHHIMDTDRQLAGFILTKRSQR